ncbi:hypothetical protein HII31_03308 [Pseudocercospora fuligena]|uniref:Uncharacterized protein n=1 Tax=Pseudocercospora fuligena TaxID=685502 RepID=A0A8H6RQR4_9PEZI|nr:hypothetical protein HII31_03308 [Pseudocercospora fuligena]
MYEPDAEELKWIYQDPQRTDKYYHSMSKAFAMMARGAATSLHEPQDYLNPPLTGIFGKTEVPTLGNYTDIAALWKIKNDPLRTNDQNIAAADVYYGPYYHAPRYANLVQQNMWETEQLLKNKPPQEHDTTGNNGVAAGSSCYLMTDEKHPLNAAAGGRGV